MPDLANSLLALDDHDEEYLAHHAPSLDVAPERLERVARVAYRISQIEADRTRKQLPAGTIVRPARTWTERERVEHAATVLRVLQALVLLGEAEPPENNVATSH